MSACCRAFVGRLGREILGRRHRPLPWQCVAGQAAADQPAKVQPREPIVAHRLDQPLVGVILLGAGLQNLKLTDQRVILFKLAFARDRLALWDERRAIVIDDLTEDADPLCAKRDRIGRRQLYLGQPRPRNFQSRLGPGDAAAALIENGQFEVERRAFDHRPVDLPLAIISDRRGSEQPEMAGNRRRPGGDAGALASRQ